ncbi:hypothetical protein PHYSODRAFT_303954 [Phytophthora sojae]|uniref:Uncharacterized protein n=1 Tax=Phytophthora sojae (strain P6497) TaxID=1094619 RepID=G4ZVI0_PHYSP|nr:hypothetical protein PHYSODRAFT_303954 [Phytophthora sojae]EGZ12219.1 hypothetical protein PHYSODRAFT_303954 [Phytophthora sojae]|eukprot:XP_009532552.1 hypothetical protein PHYSODRAFT_303954 [Phytophthora sojae]
MNTNFIPNEDVEIIFDDDFFSDSKSDCGESNINVFSDSDEYLMSAKDYLYEIECKLTQYCPLRSAHGDGFFIRINLIKEIHSNMTVAKLQHNQRFQEEIAEELVLTTMHPCRIQDQMNRFDDIEQYFTAMRY